MGVLANYEPKEVFKYFEEICSIPHGSGNTDAIAEYLVKFAADHGLEHYRDNANNVIIRKKGSPGYPDCPLFKLRKEIVILIGCKIILGSAVSAKRFSVSEFLNVLQSAGNTL